MNPRALRRIAALHRELAEEYEALAAEEEAGFPAPAKAKRPRVSGEPPAAPEMVARVRRSLRRQGVSA